MVISVASQKGGTGKSSSAISLAAGVAHRGKRVLLIDVDPQANSSKVLIEDYGEVARADTVYATIIHRNALPIFPSTVKGLHISPSHILLAETDITLTTAKDHREARLKSGLMRFAGDYDHVVIDTPPNLGWLTLNAFTASEKIIVTVSPGFFELDSLIQLGKVVEEVREYYNPDLELAGFLFTLSDPTVSSRESLKILRQTYTGQVFKTVIPRNVDLRDASFRKQDVFTYNSKCKAAMAYQNLIKELGL